MLIKYGSDVNAEDINGLIPMFMAIPRGLIFKKQPKTNHPYEVENNQVKEKHLTFKVIRRWLSYSLILAQM